MAAENMAYAVERYEADVPVREYIEECVDVPAFLECCKQCGNYEKVWSCPSYDFHPEEYWRKYENLHLIGIKICFPREMTEKTYEKEELDTLVHETLWAEKKKLTAELMEMEKENPGSVSLSAGSCMNCRQCTRPTGEPCRFPDKMRYSIESIGGNVGLTVTKYLKQELLWMEEGRLPGHFILVCGLLS